MSLWVKKGAWTEEEDDLLQKCVKRHGEGHWHLVPSRAGLNRCRRSCRLRWMNYLKPNIKRGEFEGDEIDLMIRLHKLLGNKWSLIAGRIPGRTANHVKNYFNTRLGKEITSDKEKPKEKPRRTAKVKVIKPHPRTFSKSSAWLSGKATLITWAALGLNPDNDVPPTTESAWWEGLSWEMDSFDTVPGNTSGIVSGETTLMAVQDKEDWDANSFYDDLQNLLNATP